MYICIRKQQQRMISYLITIYRSYNYTLYNVFFIIFEVYVAIEISTGCISGCKLPPQK